MALGVPMSGIFDAASKMDLCRIIFLKFVATSPPGDQLSVDLKDRQFFLGTNGQLSVHLQDRQFEDWFGQEKTKRLALWQIFEWDCSILAELVSIAFFGGISLLMAFYGAKAAAWVDRVIGEAGDYDTYIGVFTAVAKNKGSFGGHCHGIAKYRTQTTWCMPFLLPAVRQVPPSQAVTYL